MSKKRYIFWSFLAKGFCNLKNELFKSEIKLIVKGGVSMWLPFLYLGLGILIGFCKMKWLEKFFAKLIYIALVVVMMVIGANIGIDQGLIKNIGWIGLKAAGLALGVVGFSVLYSVLLERTIVPLDKMTEALDGEKESLDKDTEKSEKKGISLFTLCIPLYVLGGVGFGYFLISPEYAKFLGGLMTGSLIVVYVGIGVSIGSDLRVFRYLYLLGWRVLLFTIAIIAGSLTGALVMTPLLSIPWSTGILSAIGMSYFTLTGAFMTQNFGTEAGVYGFLVNVFRDFITVLLLPLLVRLGKSAPIAGAAAGSMDILLLPVTRTIGSKLGLVAFITGTIIVLIVPFLLPLFSEALKLFS